DDGATDAQNIAVTVTDVNEAPMAADITLTTDEDTARAFAAADFAFSDEDDGDTLGAVRIDTLPTAGTLALDGNAVTDGQSISASDIANGLLTFTPAADANGDDYASFTFSVSDGSVFSSSHTMTLDVTAVNDAPTITSDGGSDTATKRVAENQIAVTTVAASDPDAGDTATFSIS
ncbi:Ig-like domain-containing protein, partial [Halomonas sabkhae]|uniref:cadherin-like domain-containing protein n=1 Tax=Halomonas sabkhae TaxID=626223 RepID=UPI0025B38659